ncbi:hypothetical protein ACLB2K_058422 [Fragaria x ananassa]
MRARVDQFVLRFTRADDRKNILTGGPWFYGRSLFVLVEYDGLEDVTSVSIDSFPVWVKIKDLPDALYTDEAVEKVGWTLGQVEHVDQMNIRRGTWARVRILQKLSVQIKEDFGEMPFEFRSRRFPVKLNVKYDRTVGFCRVTALTELIGSGKASDKLLLLNYPFSLLAMLRGLLRPSTSTTSSKVSKKKRI